MSKKYAELSELLANVDDDVQEAIRESILFSNGVEIETLEYIISFCEVLVQEIEEGV